MKVDKCTRNIGFIFRDKPQKNSSEHKKNLDDIFYPNLYVVINMSKYSHLKEFN